ncbi:MAG: hypothetical protein MJZ51_03680 [Bacteroidales bacterium]|nr:hypothetical protein [Bacteroidales bacterium]
MRRKSNNKANHHEEAPLLEPQKAKNGTRNRQNAGFKPTRRQKNFHTSHIDNQRSNKKSSTKTKKSFAGIKK